MNNEIITISLNFEETDYVLNALEEKALNVNNLRQKIYDNAKYQADIIKNNKEIEKGKEIIMENIKIVCKDCGKEFDFTVKEQKFFEEKGFQAPIRCKECREIKKNKNIEKQSNSFEDMLKEFQKNTVKINKK